MKEGAGYPFRGNSIACVQKTTFRWQDSFFRRGELILDRHFGYQVQLFTDIAPDHPWLALGFLLSMHIHTIPFLLYDQEQRVLVVSQPEKKVTLREDVGIIHLFSLLQRMGVDENEFGKVYNVQGAIVMSLVDEP